ncbi:MAG: glycosyltransferase family 2 protein [Candidatus Electrothrix sp. GW3-4]|uniref:glycosyltransferase family 2 protein n=1 Tax=Candidatus Electrothrix sp. GW3-4 TaxID=3126740 RepID=UPI0030CE56F4
MKVTVIITCFNEGAKLKRAMESLASQTDQDFETLIVKDYSEHYETVEICKNFEAQEGVRVIWLPENLGPAAARNAGYQAMVGEICIPLDGDDELPTETVFEVKSAFAQNDGVGYLFGDYEIIHDNGKYEHVNCSVVCNDNRQMNYRACLSEWIMLGMSPCRKSTWKQVGGYDEGLVISQREDVDFWTRVFGKEIQGVYVNRIIYRWNRSESGRNALSRKQAVDNLTLLERNIQVYDKFGLGIDVRMRLIKGFLLNKEACRTKIHAKWLFRHNVFNFMTFIVLMLPSNFASFVYSVCLALRRRLTKLWCRY